MKIIPTESMETNSAEGVQGTIGAQVNDIQLSDVNEDQVVKLQEALHQHSVLFFRQQSLTPAQHVALAKKFGAIEPMHPFFPFVEQEPQIAKIESRPDSPPGVSYWHTDMTWQANPPKMSILHGKIIPPQGGDTIWCSMQKVFSDLPAELQNRVREFTCVHELAAFAGSKYDEVDETGQSSVAKKSVDYPPVDHPMVIEHPITGLPVLFINEQFTQYVKGMDVTESKHLLSTLFAEARRSEHQVRFQWQSDSVAMWDNFATQHFAVTDYGAADRLLHRVTLQGRRLSPFHPQ